MRSPRRPAQVVVVACAAVLGSLAPTAAAAPPPTDTVYLGLGLSVVAPAPGFGVAASAVMVDGGHLDLVLETAADGVTRRIAEPGETQVDMDAVAADAAGSAGIAGGGDACSDDEYNLLPTKWHTTWRWWFHAGSKPAGISRSRAENQLRSAVASITGSRNDCGMADDGQRESQLSRTYHHPAEHQ